MVQEGADGGDEEAGAGGEVGELGGFDGAGFDGWGVS